MKLPEQMTADERLRFLIGTVCAATADQQALAIAKWCTMNTRGRAAANLDYYLSGNGGSRMFDPQSILREGQGVRECVTTEISKALSSGRRSGEVFISQQTYCVQDWPYALGGLVISWHFSPSPAWVNGSPATVSLTFRNKYCWHPFEPRVTQALHQAAERLKTKGAQDFWMEGSATLTIN